MMTEKQLKKSMKIYSLGVLFFTLAVVLLVILGAFAYLFGI